jgi:hypothetical protein
VLRTSHHRLPRALHLALACLIVVEGSFNLAHGLAEDRDLQLIAFGTAEAVGAVLFAWLRTIGVGTCILVCTFLIAAGVHVLERDMPIEHLVYAIAVLVVLSHYRTSLGPGRPAA